MFLAHCVRVPVLDDLPLLTFKFFCTDITFFRQYNYLLLMCVSIISFYFDPRKSRFRPQSEIVYRNGKTLLVHYRTLPPFYLRVYVIKMKLRLSRFASTFFIGSSVRWNISRQNRTTFKFSTPLSPQQISSFYGVENSLVRILGKNL